MILINIYYNFIYNIFKNFIINKNNNILLIYLKLLNSKKRKIIYNNIIVGNCKSKMYLVNEKLFFCL